MARDPQAYAQAQASGSRSWFQLCMRFVANAITGNNSGYADANEGYNAVAGKVGSYNGVPPANVPVWWTGGKYGHVALSAGGGYAWTNDYAGKGKISKERIEDIDRWLGTRFTYRGYTPEYGNKGQNITQRAGRLPGGSDRLTDEQIYAVARAAGFSRDQARTMTAIAIAESDSKPLAKNDTRGRTNLPQGTQPEYSFGLWQINVKANGDLLDGAKPETLYDPLTNAKAAKAIYDRQGFNAWSTYKNRTIFKDKG